MRITLSQNTKTPQKEQLLKYVQEYQDRINITPIFSQKPNFNLTIFEYSL